MRLLQDLSKLNPTFSFISVYFAGDWETTTFIYSIFKIIAKQRQTMMINAKQSRLTFFGTKFQFNFPIFPFGHYWAFISMNFHLFLHLCTKKNFGIA